MASANKKLPEMPSLSFKQPQTIHMSNESLSSQRIKNMNSEPPSLSLRRKGPELSLNIRNNNTNMESYRNFTDDPLQFSASSADDAFLLTDNETMTPGTPIRTPYRPSSTRNNSNVVIVQKSDSNMISTRLMSSKSNKFNSSSDSIDSEIPLRSMNRRNAKKLTLDPINTNIGNSEIPNSPLLNVKDPERRIDADELIENIRNLELGLEYQMSIRADELVSLKKLGSGQSGTVSKVLHLPSQKTMARKTVHLEAKEVIQSQILRELRIMHECNSPFIIDFYGTFLNEGNVVICMEYADCGSLAHVFKITGSFPEFMLKHVAYSVLSGLIYLYDNHRIIHRDVKPSNVLLTSKGRVKLCDFGVSRELINSLADTFVGTSTYMSPERIQGGVYSVKGDVWSLGIMLYELASGNLAFANDNNSSSTSILELLQRIVNEKPPSLSTKEGYSEELCDFISLCLKKENQRSSPWSLMSHPFLSDFLDDDKIHISSKYKSDIKKWSKNVRRVQKGKPIKETE